MISRIATDESHIDGDSPDPSLFNLRPIDNGLLSAMLSDGLTDAEKWSRAKKTKKGFAVVGSADFYGKDVLRICLEAINDKGFHVAIHGLPNPTSESRLFLRAQLRLCSISKISRPPTKQI